ncbi:alpha-2-macroglobulin [Citrobacter sp. JGM124]|uniref:alpha-2-macroglobulin family protein n=1 Tax=Citrobacter sp. JGM124 TaxID=2799789 RepID=UPI001BA752E3|nr:alpha-2-macroglobulin [Citrobacter sp. JGM124]MBS0849036.1 alpha-2-macroglobulin family protein [Citrobacter sp. JGM124]
MKQNAFISLMLLLGSVISLTGCDDETKKQAQDTPQATRTEQPASVSNKLSVEQLDKLRQQSQGKPFTLLDVSEVQLDGANALSLTFSVPLDPDQDFRRVLKVTDKSEGALDGAWELSPNLKTVYLRHLEPNRELNIAVDEGLLALNHTQLSQSKSESLTTRDIQPSVGFASTGSLLPSKVISGLPVMALNVDKIDVNFYRVNERSLSKFIHEWRYRSSLSSWESDEILDMDDLVYTGRFDLNPERNKSEKLLLPLSAIKPLQQPGVYLAVMSKAGSYAYTNPATLFTLSDIGLSAHRYNDRLDIYTQSLEEGQVLPEVELTLMDSKGSPVGHTVSDADGHASFNHSGNDGVLLAHQGGQTTLLDLRRPALDLAEFNISGEQDHDKQLFLFGPRDLYRPGETVILNGLMRDREGKPLPEQPVKLEVIKPDGQVSYTQTWQPQNGLYQFTYRLGDNVSTGRWQIRANTGDNQPRNWSFQVEDFMPERMALELTTQSSPVTPEDDVEFEVSGRYLYGAPAAGNSLQGQLFVRPLRDAVAKLPGFQFGDINEKNLYRNLDEVELTLNEQGHGTISTASQWQETHSPLRVILQASLLESGGRPVTRRAEQIVWPASQLPGIRPQFNSKEVYDYRTNTTQTRPIVDENSLAGFDIVYGDPAGNKHAVNDLNVKLIQERRDYYWSWSESDGWQSQYDQKELVQAEQPLNLAEGETGSVSFPVEWGAYRLEVEDPQHGITSSVRFWAGYDWQDNSGTDGGKRPDQVTLKLDKPAYNPGDTVHLSINAPAAGQGYALIESSEGPLWWQAIDVPEGGMMLDIPIDSRWKRQDLYISALVVRPGDPSRSATLKRAVGVLHLPLSEEHHRLQLTLNSPDKMTPNQDLHVKVKASTTEGALPQQIKVLLSAVDIGVLNITDYKTPSPWDAFFGRKRYGADIYDIYGQVIEGSGRLASLSFGGDGDEGDELSRGGKKPVNHVNIVAQQAVPVTLDEHGEGTVSLPVGDFNGELKIMAQAWSDDKFGSGESHTLVAAPLITELAAPRFMAGGDQSRLALDVSNMTDVVQNIQVHLAAAGLLRLDATQPQSSLVLSPGERKTLFIPVTAKEGWGTGELNLVVSGPALPGDQRLTKNWKIGIRPAFPATTSNSGVVLATDEVWTFPPELISGLVPETIEGQLLISGQPPLNLSRYIRELNAYPYGCLEQTVSGLYPSLYTNQLSLTQLGIKGISDSLRHEAVETGIGRLLDMQNDKGGFGLWDKSGPEEYWLTAYATDFLVRAAEQGYHVNTDVLNKANKRLLQYLTDPSLIDIRYGNQVAASRFAVQAYAGLVLARQQKAPLGALRELWARHGQSENGLPLVQLGVALKLMGDDPRSQKALELGLATPRRDDRVWLGDYGSDLRDLAAMLSLLEEYALLPEQQNQLLLQLSNRAWGERWLSTQETNALFLAGRNLHNKQDNWQALTSLSDQPVTGTQPKTLNLTADPLAHLSVQNRGEQPLYLRVDSSGYLQQMPQPQANVLHIERQFLDSDGNNRSLSSLRSGELVIVKLSVWADRDVPDALVVDMLPAGFELENQNLANSSAQFSDNAPGSQLSQWVEQMQQQDIQHMEFRDDRFVAALSLPRKEHATLLYLARAVTPGTYRVPMPQVESMYVPQWRATGATPASLTIVP